MGGVIWTQYWGISTLDYTVWPAQYIYAEWLDCKRNTQYFQLDRKPTTTIWWVTCWFSTDTLMLCMIPIPNRDSTKYPNFYLGDWGNVYYYDWTKVGNGLCGWKDIVNATLFNMEVSGTPTLVYIMYCVDDYTNPTKWNLYYIKVSDAWTGAGSWNGDEALVPGVPTDFAVWDKYNHSRQFINESNRLLYYVAWNQINTLDYLGIYRNRMTTDFYITGLTKHNQLFRVYTHCSKIYYWDGYSPYFDWSINISYNVRYVWNQWDIDYVVLWTLPNKSFMGIFTGQNLQFINKSVKTEVVDVSNFYKFQYTISNMGSNYNMAQYGNIVYMPIIWLLGGSNYMGIASYGAEYFGFPNGVFIESSKTASNKSMTEIGFVANPLNLWMILQYSYTDTSGNHWIEGVDLSPSATASYVPTGTLYTKRMDELMIEWKSSASLVSSPWKMKRTKEFDIRAYVPTGTTMEILYTIDWGSTYTSLTTITPAVSWNWDAKRWRKYGIDCDITYYDIAFKIILTTSNSAVTPRFYQLSFTSEEVKA